MFVFPLHAKYDVGPYVFHMLCILCAHTSFNVATFRDQGVMLHLIILINYANYKIRASFINDNL